MEYTDLQLKCAEAASKCVDEEGDLYSELTICRLMRGMDIKENNEKVRRSALYMDLPHPNGRDVRGENDFAAIRLAAALYVVPDKLEEETKALIKRYLLERDFTSMYGSENHTFMMRVARLLAAEYYGEPFRQFGITAEEAIKRDKAFILEFILFRAKYGFGEFNSICYLGEDLFMSSVLENYARDEEIKRAARMFNDIILIERLANNSRDGVICGGYGRTYPNGQLNMRYGAGVYDFAVNGVISGCPSEYALAPFHFDSFVVEALRNRQFPQEITERKHLHSMYAWRSDVPDRAQLKKLHDAGSITKYTYLDEKYAIGAINRQDEYPVDGTEDYVYAHHQQVEWSCRIFGDTPEDYTVLFSSHPGKTGEHNYWTGDLKCCCCRSYATKNSAMIIYDIKDDEEYDFTHLFIQPEKYETALYEKNRIYLSKNGCYVCVFIDKPFTLEHNDEYECDEIISRGRQNAYALKIAFKEEYASLDAFRAAMEKTAFALDTDSMTLTFDNIVMNKKTVTVDGVDASAHTEWTRLAPWCSSKWESGIVSIGGHTLDFNGFSVK